MHYVSFDLKAYDVRLDPSVKDSFSVVGYAGNLDPASSTDLLIAIPATNYMEFSPRTKQYASRVYFTETSGGVLGSNTMQGHNVVFDWENGRYVHHLVSALFVPRMSWRNVVSSKLSFFF